jgi:hypothetical protein
MKKVFVFTLLIASMLLPVSAQALSVGLWNGGFVEEMPANFPTLGVQMTDALAGYVGMNSFGLSHTTLKVFFVKVDYNLVKAGNVQTKIGAYSVMIPDSEESTVGLTWGASVMVAKNLSVGFDVKLVEQLLETGRDNDVMSILPGGAICVNFYL